MGKGIIGMILVSAFISMAGCASAPYLGAAIFGAGAAAVTAWDWKETIKEVDWRDSIEADFNQVWQAALTTVEEMKIEISEKKLNEEKNGGIITGKTNRHEKIQVIVGASTPVITDIGIKAHIREIWNMPITAQDVDIPFAAAIGMGIKEKCTQ